MTFRKQLFAGQASLVVVVLLMGISALLALRSVTRAARVAAEATEELALVHELRLEAEQLVSSGRGYLLTGSEAQRARMLEVDARFDRTLAAVRSTVAEHTLASDALARIAADADAYVAGLREAAERRAESSDLATFVDLIEAQLLPLRSRFESDVDAFLHREGGMLTASARDAETFGRDAQFILTGLSCIAVGLSLALAALVTRRLLRQYQQTQQASEAAQRASQSREELLAVVSHDLRAPLTTVTFGATLLEEMHTEDVSRYARRITNAAKRMQHLIDGLIERARIEAGTLVLDKERCDRTQLCETALELFHDRAARERVALIADADPGEVYLDRERILQVLGNLIGNALKYTHEGDTITVRARGGEHETHFAVEDTGSGIPDEQQTHLFDAHFQGRARDSSSGLGLGLYISRSLVEAHGGQIGVDSMVGKGTTFHFTIPDAASRP